MLSISSLLHQRISFTALLLAFLSITVIVVTPPSLERNLLARQSSASFQRSNTFTEMTAAIGSLQSGQSPLSKGPVSCSAVGQGSAYCETIDSGQAVSTSSLSGPWTNITGSSAPSPRNGASMAYDAADGYVVLFGGFYSPFGDTWKFLGGTWTNITSSSGPSPRSDAMMVYDGADGYVVLFGGITIAFSRFVGDTWKFLNGSWSNITPSSGPSPRAHGSMTYDAADRYVILFGGLTKSGVTLVRLSDTWEFLAGSWTNILPSSPLLARDYTSMAYDAADGYVILFGGQANAITFGDTWKFLAGTWTNITSSSSAPPRYAATMVYDAADGYVILFGGDNGPSYLGDTWKFLGGSWTNITSSNSPSPRYETSTAYDASDGYVILFGGIGCSGSGYCGDTWEFSSPPAFDYSLSNSGPASVQQGSFVSVTVTVQLTAGAAQSVALSCVASSLPTGVSCMFSPLTVTPAQAGVASILNLGTNSSTPAGSFTIQVTGTPLGATSVPTSFVLTVSPLPITAVIISSAAVADSPANFTGNANGGVAPYTYSWAFGDGSIGTGNTTSHTYSSSGALIVTLTVTDATSASQSFTESITVLPSTLVFSQKTSALGLNATITGNYNVTGSPTMAINGQTSLEVSNTTTGASVSSRIVSISESFGSAFKVALIINFATSSYPMAVSCVLKVIDGSSSCFLSRTPDTNNDGSVNIQDLAFVAFHFGTTMGDPGYNAIADINGDGVVNIQDLAFIAFFFKAPAY